MQPTSYSHSELFATRKGKNLRSLHSYVIRDTLFCSWCLKCADPWSNNAARGAQLKRSHRGWGVISGGPEAQLRRARWTDLDRLSFLAQFSCLLSYSLDYAITLQTIAGQMIPDIADWCFLQVQEGEGLLQRIAAANLDSRRTAEKLKDLVKAKCYPSSAALPSNAEVAAPVPDEWLDQLASDSAERSILAATGAHSGMRVPLLLGNACLGLLTLFAANRTYTGVDLVFGLEIGHRAAVAIHNARQYRSAVEAAAKRSLVNVE